MNGATAPTNINTRRDILSAGLPLEGDKASRTQAPISAVMGGVCDDRALRAGRVYVKA